MTPNTPPEIHRLTSLSAPLAAPYTSLTEAQLRSRLDPSRALFIAESPKVINVALDAGYTPVSILCEERHLTGDAAPIIARCPGIQIITGSRELLASLTGYTLTRGVLCAMRRPAPRPVADVIAGASTICVIDSVVDTTNIGAIFRSAAALGIDAILLTPTSCDPLNRRSIRVSMGSVFLIPWTWIDAPLTTLSAQGFATIAMALTPDSLPIHSPVLTALPRKAIIMGTEGEGLDPAVIAAADHVARIPMHHGVDSLNVAAASAIAFYLLTPHP